MIGGTVGARYTACGATRPCTSLRTGLGLRSGGRADTELLSGANKWFYRMVALRGKLLILRGSQKPWPGKGGGRVREPAMDKLRVAWKIARPQPPAGATRLPDNEPTD